MPTTLPIEIYEMLEARLGKEDAKELVKAIEDVTKSLAKESKRDLKDELKEELVTKTEFHAEFKVLRSEFRMYFIVLVCLIILLNPHAIELIAKLLGVVK